MAPAVVGGAASNAPPSAIAMPFDRWQINRALDGGGDLQFLELDFRSSLRNIIAVSIGCGSKAAAHDVYADRNMGMSIKGLSRTIAMNRKLRTLSLLFDVAPDRMRMSLSAAAVRGVCSHRVPSSRSSHFLGARPHRNGNMG